jgi:hypothetical protein
LRSERGTIQSVQQRTRSFRAKTRKSNGGAPPVRRDKSAGIARHLWMAVWLLPLVQGVHPATAQSGVDLIVESSPAAGGVITPGAGTHRFAIESEVTMTATPQEGYKFAYWLGDVSDPTSSTTCIRMAGARSVIAVFERDQTGALTEQEEDLIVRSPGGGGGGGLVATPSDFWTGGSLSVTGGGRVVRQTIVWEIPAAPVPEPATLTLMGMGLGILARARGRSRSGRS